MPETTLLSRPIGERSRGGSSLSDEQIQELYDIANRLRIWSIRSTTVAGTGHPTSCCSMAEIMAVLFFSTMRYKVNAPRDPSSDRFVLSKGHGAPILYAAWREAGLLNDDDLLSLRKIESDVEGHPTPRLSFVDVATGSLGQGLSCAAGMAYTAKYFDKASYRVYCVVGDGESAEGSIWEALAFSSHYKLDNLVVIFDVNRFGQSDVTPYQHKMDVYEARIKAFGFKTIVVDGHSVDEVKGAFESAKLTKDMPTAILAKTFKGHGIDGMENSSAFHGKIVPADKCKHVIKVIESKLSNKEEGLRTCLPRAPAIDDASPVRREPITLSEKPSYTLGEKIAPRAAYGKALVKLGASDDRVISLDGDMRGSTFAEMFRKKFPQRFIEGFIAEQNIVGVAVGCGCRGRTVPFLSTYAAFLTRAFDQVRMAAISQANVKFIGSHAGISVGPDGPSQMGLEDLAMFRSVPEMVVFYPSDAVSTERACELAANETTMCYVRITRPDLPVLYNNEESFEIGKAKVVRENNDDNVLIVGAGVTLAEAVTAAEHLQSIGISARILDLFTIKPIDKDALILHASQVGGRVVTVEDHYAEGGLGEAVSAALTDKENLKMKILAVRGVPRSGKPADLLKMFQIDSSAIIEAVQEILSF